MNDMIKKIAGKTNDEILSMTYKIRYHWYKTISQREKEEAMRIVGILKQAKLIGRLVSKETRDKISASKMGKKYPSPSKEIRDKISRAKIGWIPTEETIANMCASWTPKRRAEMSAKWTGNVISEETRSKIGASKIGKIRTKESRSKQSVSVMGEKNPNYIDGRSFLPYCRLFNEKRKEEIRNYWGRVCVLTDLMRSTLGSESGLDDFEGYEIFSGQRSSVHHIYGNKMAGCDGTELALIPLQNKFNTKKFDGLKLEEHPFYITLFMLKDIERKHREEEND